MNTQLTNYIRDSSVDRYTRQIDLDYQIMKTGNSSDLKDISFALLKHQVAFANKNIQELETISRHQDETRESISNFSQAVSNGFKRIELGLMDLGSCLWQLYDISLEISREISLVNKNLEHISNQLALQQQTLEEISLLLQHPYKAKALELRQEGEKWLTNGMNKSGCEREEDWEDAIRLLSLASENPIGMQDYAVWFQLGWLWWKSNSDLDKAKDAFYRAQRLSSPNQNLFHIKSLRHLAHLQYLTGNFKQAYQTIKQAFKVIKSRNEDIILHNVMYDCSRLAAKIGNEEESMNLLERCIEIRPETYLSMFSEDDFHKNREALLELASRKLFQARDHAKKNIDSFQDDISQIKRAVEYAELVGNNIFNKSLIEDSYKNTLQLKDIIDRTDYLTSLEISETANSTSQSCMSTAEKSLKNEFNNLQDELLKYYEALNTIEGEKAKLSETIEDKKPRKNKQIDKTKKSLMFSIFVPVFGFPVYWIGWHIIGLIIKLFLIIFYNNSELSVPWWPEHFSAYSLVAALLTVVGGTLTFTIQDLQKLSEVKTKFRKEEQENRKGRQEFRKGLLNLEKEIDIVKEKKKRVVYAMSKILNLPSPEINDMRDDIINQLYLS